MGEYTTVAGDMWDIVAFKALGDEKYMGRIIELNPRHRDTFIFQAGVKLLLPEKEAGAPRSLPPWKRSGAWAS